MLSKIEAPYTLQDMRDREGKNSLKVLSCFSGGGGSSMGYKLAGFDVLGGVEIDPRMAELYEKNLRPKKMFVESVGDFVLSDAQKDFHGVDILDGSPPCSSFSMAGSRDKVWGKAKKFREGQAEQVLDSLFKDFLSLAGKLKPKIVVAENVMGMVSGKAKGFALEVLDILRGLGYVPQVFVLNASRMGVPQTRRRVFFIASREGLNLSPLKLNFDELAITASEACAGCDKSDAKFFPQKTKDLWETTEQGKLLDPRGLFKNRRAAAHLSFSTQSASHPLMHWSEPRFLSSQETRRAQSFPDDYDFIEHKPHYVCGMSVPPLMMQRLALEIERQWLSVGKN